MAERTTPVRSESLLPLVSTGVVLFILAYLVSVRTPLSHNLIAVVICLGSSTSLLLTVFAKRVLGHDGRSDTITWSVTTIAALSAIFVRLLLSPELAFMILILAWIFALGRIIWRRSRLP